MLKKYILTFVTFLLKTPLMTPYDHLLQVGFLGKQTWKCYCVGVSLGKALKIITDGKEGKKLQN